MKTIITVIFLLFVVGCAPQSNYIWTPTAAEWELMGPTERNQWYLTEMLARQRQQQSRQRFLDAFSEFCEKRSKGPTITFPPSRQPSFPSNYWQERQAEQEYWDNQRRKYGIPSY